MLNSQWTLNNNAEIYSSIEIIVKSIVNIFSVYKYDGNWSYLEHYKYDDWSYLQHCNNDGYRSYLQHYEYRYQSFL